MEIERKFLVLHLPKDLGDYPHDTIEQGYLCTDPVVRVRRQGESYVLTYKGPGLMVREEYNLPLSESGYAHLLAKADGTPITKERYRIPFQGHTIELDIFARPFAPLVLAGVEFDTEEAAKAFTPPDWFGREVTGDPAYTNANLSRRACLEI